MKTVVTKLDKLISQPSFLQTNHGVSKNLLSNFQSSWNAYVVSNVEFGDVENKVTGPAYKLFTKQYLNKLGVLLQDCIKDPSNTTDEQYLLLVMVVAFYCRFYKNVHVYKPIGLSSNITPQNIGFTNQNLSRVSGLIEILDKSTAELQQIKLKENEKILLTVTINRLSRMV